MKLRIRPLVEIFFVGLVCLLFVPIAVAQSSQVQDILEALQASFKCALQPTTNRYPADDLEDRFLAIQSFIGDDKQLVVISKRIHRFQDLKTGSVTSHESDFKIEVQFLDVNSVALRNQTGSEGDYVVSVRCEGDRSCIKNTAINCTNCQAVNPNLTTVEFRFCDGDTAKLAARALKELVNARRNSGQQPPVSDSSIRGSQTQDKMFDTIDYGRVVPAKK